MASNDLLSALTSGRIRLPDSVINYGAGNPLPQFPPGATHMRTADGLFNHVTNLLSPAATQPYAYGPEGRLSTQSQMAHPNRVALIIPKLYIPAPESDGHDMDGDPVLEHAVSDGDLIFTFRIPSTSSACQAPYGHAAKAVPLLNLATVNYILWGLQVGMRRQKNKRWSDFFKKLTKNGDFIGMLLSGEADEASIWGFIRTYIRPFGIQHGSDMAGGMHEGSTNNIVTHGATDYVSSYAIEGRLQHVNNLWRDYDVHENDDLVLALRKKEPGEILNFNLSSSVRATRTERVPVSSPYYYLRPETLKHRSFAETCYIHVGRSFKYCSMYTRTPEAACWDARVAVVPGAPVMVTFEPSFVDSEDMFYAMFESDCCIVAAAPHRRCCGDEEEDDGTGKKRQREAVDDAAAPVHAISANKKAKPSAAGVIAAKSKPAPKP
jgi:hypothetical protein